MDTRGRWPRTAAKHPVEVCLQLSVKPLAKFLTDGRPLTGQLVWQGGGVQELAEFSLEYTGPRSALLQLRYGLEVGGSVQAVAEQIRIEASHQHFGGLRWYFLCPLTANEHACVHTAWILYLPPEEMYFGCRHCHNLSYRSRQRGRMRTRFRAAVTRNL